MKKIVLIIFLFQCSASAQISIKKIKVNANKIQQYVTPKNLSSEDIVNGLKEALIIGATTSSNDASQIGGFNNNILIKIPFPKDAEKMKSTLLKIGMQMQIEQFEVTINEAAEEASIFAKDIFIQEIKNISIDDGQSILNGNENAATKFLEKKTTKELYLKFKPVIKTSIQKVSLTKYWNVLVDSYNMIPLTKNVNVDLEDYVTKKAISGLFTLIAKEEKNIRENPKARVSEILQKVFK